MPIKLPSRLPGMCTSCESTGRIKVRSGSDTIAPKGTLVDVGCPECSLEYAENKVTYLQDRLDSTQDWLEKFQSSIASEAIKQMKLLQLLNRLRDDMWDISNRYESCPGALLTEYMKGENALANGIGGEIAAFLRENGYE